MSSAYERMSRRATTKSQKRRLEVNEFRVDVWSHEGRSTRNDHVRGSVKVTPVTKNIADKKLTWHGHGKRPEEGIGGKKNGRCTSSRKRRRG